MTRSRSRSSSSTTAWSLRCMTSWSARHLDARFEQLEQINAALMDAIWKHRSDYNRNLVLKEVTEAFNVIIKDIETMQEILKSSQEEEEAELRRQVPLHTRRLVSRRTQARRLSVGIMCKYPSLCGEVGPFGWHRARCLAQDREVHLSVRVGTHFSYWRLWHSLRVSPHYPTHVL